MKNKIYRYYFFLCCQLPLAMFFSCSQKSPVHLQEKVEALLDSSVTQYFGEQIYMDVWERLWIPHYQQLACIDLLADTLDIQFVELGINANIHDVCWQNNGNMIVATDNVLISIDDDGYTEIANLPYSGMRIEAASDSTFYIFGKSAVRNEYDVSLIDMSGNIQRLFSTEEKIIDVAGNGYVTVLVLSKELALFSPEVAPTVFFSFENEINAIAITDYGGFFVATSNGIYYFEDVDHYYMFSEIGAKKLWFRNQKLYILFENGNLTVFSMSS